MEHTKGPWEAKQGGDNHFTIEDKDNSYIAEISWRHFNNEANAKLIAAAPELLEMLKEAVERCEINNGEGEEDEFIEMFNATIAKAEGK